MTGHLEVLCQLLMRKVFFTHPFKCIFRYLCTKVVYEVMNNLRESEGVPSDFYTMDLLPKSLANHPLSCSCSSLVLIFDWVWLFLVGIL